MKPRFQILAALAALTAGALFAADEPGPVLWSLSDMKTMDKDLAKKMDATGAALSTLIARQTFSAITLHRGGSGQSEVHEKLADFIIVRSGKGAILVGGKSIDPKPTAPGETRGSGIEGGKRYTLTPGDVLFIPAGTPHQLILEKGGELNALVVKVEDK